MSFDEADVIVRLSPEAFAQYRAHARRIAESVRDALALAVSEARRGGLEGADVTAFGNAANEYLWRVVNSLGPEMLDGMPQPDPAEASEVEAASRPVM